MPVRTNVQVHLRKVKEIMESKRNSLATISSNVSSHGLSPSPMRVANIATQHRNSKSSIIPITTTLEKGVKNLQQLNET
jgi:hypothetical protein